MRLKDKVAVVTGSGSGFGEAIARLFAAEGASVVINCRSAASGERVASEIEAAAGPGRVLFVAADVATREGWQALVRASLERFGRIDVLVNNAGLNQPVVPMLEVDEATFDRLFEVNFKSIYLSAQEVVPHMRAQGGGVIINNASIAAKRPRKGQTWYAGIKAGVVTLSKAMALELGPDRIRVNALCPVMTRTPMIEDKLTPEREARAIGEIPLGRLGETRDLANAALFLASDEAEFLTGIALEIDGGRSI